MNYTNFPPVKFFSHTVLSSVFIVVSMLMFCLVLLLLLFFHSLSIIRFWIKNAFYISLSKSCVHYLHGNTRCNHFLLHSRTHLDHFTVGIHVLTKGIFMIRNDFSDGERFSTNLSSSSQPIVQCALYSCLFLRRGRQRKIIIENNRKRYKGIVTVKQRFNSIHCFSLIFVSWCNDNIVT